MIGQWRGNVRQVFESWGRKREQGEKTEEEAMMKQNHMARRIHK